jgi:hypothetical protein
VKINGVNYGPKTNIYQNADVLYCPITKDRNHWVIIIAYPKKKEMYHLDGLSSTNIKYEEWCLYLVLSWILRTTEVYEDEFHIEKEVLQWNFFTNSKKNIPNQYDVYNCGILVVKYALYSARGILTFHAFDSSTNECNKSRKEFQDCIDQGQLFVVPPLSDNVSNNWKLIKPKVEQYNSIYLNAWGEAISIALELKSFVNEYENFNNDETFNSNNISLVKEILTDMISEINYEVMKIKFTILY